MSLFEVNDSDIGQLDKDQLPNLLRRLLNLEASKHGICRSGVNVAGNLNTPDGGVDGSIIWTAPPENTAILPVNYIVFQSKAERMTSTSAGKEVENRPRGGETFIKTMVDQALNAGAGYILFSNTDLTDQQRINDSIESIRAKFREHSRTYADTAYVDIFDRQKIKDWVNDFLPAVVAVKQWIGKPVPNGFYCFDQWKQFYRMEKFEYFEDDSTQQIREELALLLGKPGARSRIVGPSGIGKTRLLFEACKAVGQTERVIYCDAAVDETALLQYMSQLYANGGCSIFIVDNCPLDLHAMLQRRVPSSIALLTIDYNNDESSGSDELVIPPASENVIGRIIKNGWPKIEAENLAKIIQYAEGFPLIAVTLAADADRGVNNLGRLNDDSIKRKLLGDNASEQDLLAIEALSLFDHVGFENHVSEQYCYIAKYITGLDPSAFYQSISKFERRQLIDTRGDYKRVKPFPLAIRLAADWWEKNSVERTREVIDLISPGQSPLQLSESFCIAITKLDFVAKAVEVTAEFCGLNGPFVHAGMLKTAWGSRLFRSFVEVNPKATANALHRATKNESFEEIKTSYIGECRRNLYWAFEKLCFRAEIFEKMSLILLRFSVAENEKWGNNCTALFEQLFAPYLSGTQADPQLRLKVLERGLSHDDERVHLIIIKSLKAAIANERRTRSIGPENQGLNQKLQEWHPKTWDELYEYQDTALAMLLKLAALDSPVGESARKALSNSLRGIIRRPNYTVLYEGLDKLIKKIGGYWPDGLESIRSVRIYELDHMPEKMQQEIRPMIDAWEALLLPDNIAEKIAQIVDKPFWEHLKEKNGALVDLSEGRAVDFAHELSGNIDLLFPFSEALVTGELRKGYLFGRELALSNNNHKEFLDSLLRAIQRLNEGSRANCNVLASYLTVLKTNDFPIYQEYIDRIFEEKSLNRYYLDCVRVGGIDADNLSKILTLLKLGYIEISVIKNLAYGSVTAGVKPGAMVEFCEGVLSLNKNWAWVCLEVLYMYAHGDTEKKSVGETFFIRLISVIDFTEQENFHTMDMHYWEEVCKLIIKKDDIDLIRSITNKVFLSANTENIASISDHAIHAVLDALIKSGYYQIVLDKVAKALRNDGFLYKHNIEHLLSGSAVRDNHGHILDIPEDILMDWADRNLDVGPKYLAKAAPLYAEADGNFLCHSLAMKIIDKYGDDKDVLKNISSFAGMKFISGSLIPDMLGQKVAYEQLSEHSNPNVREWASDHLDYVNQSIDAENRREEAQGFGIF